MCFVQEYLGKDEKGQNIMIRSLLHKIKFGDEAEVYQTYLNFPLHLVTDLTKKALVRLAMFVSHAYQKRIGEIPDWARDKRLVLDKAHKAEGYTSTWFLFGPQAMLRHNYFVCPSALEVL